VLLVGFSALVAAVFLACQAPEDAPPAVSDELSNPEVKALWDRAIAAPAESAVMFKESDLNNHLRHVVKAGTGTLGIKFQRAYVSLKPGAITLVTQRNAWGLSIYSGATLKPQLAGGQWTPGVSGLSVGRLRIHPAVAQLAGGVLQPFAVAFEPQVKQLGRVQKIEAGDKVITFATNSAR
jgi:hypothetical protein